jgi:hypothetical protein
MFIHVVMYRVKDPEVNVPKMKELLCALPAKIDLIKKLRFGKDEIGSARSVDACLYTEFESKEDMLAYRDHPEHVKVADFIATIKLESYSADFAE